MFMKKMPIPCTFDSVGAYRTLWSESERVAGGTDLFVIGSVPGSIGVDISPILTLTVRSKRAVTQDGSVGMANSGMPAGR